MPSRFGCCRAFPWCSSGGAAQFREGGDLAVHEGRQARGLRQDEDVPRGQMELERLEHPREEAGRVEHVAGDDEVHALRGEGACHLWCASGGEEKGGQGYHGHMRRAGRHRIIFWSARNSKSQ